MAARFPGRRFSWFRFSILVLVVGLIAWGALLGFGWWRDTTIADTEPEPWFGAYVDVTATPQNAFETATADSAHNVTLAFVVASTSGGCEPSWGGAYTLNQAAVDLDLDRRIARTRAAGRGVVISFGGQLNDELALRCTSVADLTAAYRAVIQRYQITTIDLDIEGDALDDVASQTRRAQAVAALQQQLRTANRSLAVWLTLPVTTTGLTEAGTSAVTRFLEAGVDLAGVNAMTMNFGDSRAEDESMGAASVRALTSLHRQLGVLYQAAGLPLGEASLWRKVGATPMIGQNDLPGEVFSLADATAVNTFAAAQPVGRMSMWSLNRDVTCSINYVDVTRVNDSCSGVQQGEQSFAALLAAGFSAEPDAVSSATTRPEPSATRTEAADDPATSPYPVWNAEASYPAGTKVVWRQNVYEAKWWTQGDVPDDPVLQEYQTPWRLVGPVLPGETPVPMPSLPSDFFPEWKPGEIYKAGERVMYEGGAFQARWWNQGTSPESSLVDPGGSPWAALSQDEIRRLLAEAGKPKKAGK